jgi:hypothetical protein
MPRTSTSQSLDRPWRVYSDRDGRKIERVLRDGGEPRCPRCAGELRPESKSRLCPSLILDARACDLTCQECRRFWCIVQETQRSLQLIRMRRLAAAIEAVEPPKRSKPRSVTDFITALQR